MLVFWCSTIAESCMKSGTCSAVTQCSPAYSIIADLKAVGVTFIEYEQFEMMSELGSVI